MQSWAKDKKGDGKISMWQTAKNIYSQNGFLGFYRGVTPRIGIYFSPLSFFL